MTGLEKKRIRQAEKKASAVLRKLRNNKRNNWVSK